MSQPDISLLSDREREVLRLVAQGLQTGEIARLVGRAPGTIDTQIKSARAKLGGITRRQAGRLLTQAEHSHSLGNQPLGIADQPSIEPMSGRHPEIVQEERAIFLHEPMMVRFDDRKTDHIEGLKAVALIVAITIGLIIILAATPGLIASFKLFAAWIINLYR